MNREALFTSTREDYETPPDLVARLATVFPFTLDVCACKRNAKAPVWITKEENALRVSSWHHYIGHHDDLMGWLNPPYGYHIRQWTSRAAETYRNGGSIIGLLPSRTDTTWMHADVLLAPAVLLMRKRLAFYLPCLICGERTTRLFRLTERNELWHLPNMTMAAFHATTAAELKSMPLCDAHAPNWKAKTWKSTAPFPSALAFWVQRERLAAAGSLAYHFGDLGTFIRTME